MARTHAVRRSTTVRTNTCLYRGEGTTESEIEVEVCGSVEPFFAGDWHEPASDGEVDGVRAIFYDGKKQRDIQISDDEVKELSEKLIESTMDEPEPDLEEDYDDYDEPECDYDDEPEGY